jgi:CheY-like chemotaxis protein
MIKRAGKVVLCIGNDPVRLNLRCAFLKPYGWHLLTTASGHEGILICGREPVDSVVLDLEGDGAEVALITGELKRLHPNLPVVVLLASAEAFAPEATRQADAVILKHHETWVLPETLAAVMKRH